MNRINKRVRSDNLRCFVTFPVGLVGAVLTILPFSRKEKKIFDPSCSSPTDKKSKKNSISIISLMDNETKYKLKELSIKVKRLQPEDIGKYLKQRSSDLSVDDQVKIEAADVSVKEEPREEAAVSVDELLSDEEPEEENSKAKVFECPYAPKCTGERSSLNR